MTAMARNADSAAAANTDAATAPNVDPAEIAKFALLAQSWWDPNGPSKPLHDLNPLRLHYVERIAPLAQKQVCDVGCGGGILSEAMARAGARCWGSTWLRPCSTSRNCNALEAQIAVEYRAVAAEELAGSVRPPSIW